jgi:hypothetical protein
MVDAINVLSSGEEEKDDVSLIFSLLYFFFVKSKQTAAVGFGATSTVFHIAWSQPLAPFPSKNGVVRLSPCPGSRSGADAPSLIESFPLARSTG